MDGTTPVLLNEQIETQLRSTKPNAVNSLMKPELPSVEEKSKFFDGVRVDVSLEDVEFRKKMDKGLTLSTEVDFFDKTVGLGVKKFLKTAEQHSKAGLNIIL